MGFVVRRSLFAASLLASACGLGLDDPTAPVLRAIGPTLETRFARSNLYGAKPVTGIIALGGGDHRIREAGRLARLLPEAKLVVTGAGSRERILAVLGRDIAPERIIVEPFALTTYQNARFTAALVPHAAAERWLLVTSAIHMPRSVGAFRHAGFEVEPWPLHDLAAGSSAALGAIRHEVLGLLAYWAQGKSSALFPGPMNTATSPPALAGTAFFQQHQSAGRRIFNE